MYSARSVHAESCRKGVCTSKEKKTNGVVVVNTAVALAVGMFNDGGVTFISVMEEMRLEAGQFARQCFMDKDTLRVKNAQRQAREATHETRIARRQGR